jgi:hypothetical protein
MRKVWQPTKKLQSPPVDRGQPVEKPCSREQCRNSQNFLGKFVRFFVILGLKILRLKGLKVVFEADVNKS